MKKKFFGKYIIHTLSILIFLTGLYLNMFLKLPYKYSTICFLCSSILLAGLKFKEVFLEKK